MRCTVLYIRQVSAVTFPQLIFNVFYITDLYIDCCPSNVARLARQQTPFKSKPYLKLIFSTQTIKLAFTNLNFDLHHQSTNTI